MWGILWRPCVLVILVSDLGTVMIKQWNMLLASLGVKMVRFISTYTQWSHLVYIPGSKVHGVNMGPTWVLPAPDGLHVGPMNLAIRDLKSIDDHSSVVLGVCCTFHAEQKSGTLNRELCANTYHLINATKKAVHCELAMVKPKQIFS